MSNEQKLEKNYKAFLRYTLTGIGFTVMALTIFWVAYPLGPLLAAFITEAVVHVVRFITFRTVTFPARKGYRVSFCRYILSTLPVSLTGFACVALMRNLLDRTSLVVTTTLIGMIAGFIWSRFIYSHPARKA